MKRCLVTVILLGACTGQRAEPPTGEPPKVESAHPDPQPDPEAVPYTCMPPGLDAAERLEVVVPPRGCSWSNPGTLAAPVRLDSAESFANALSCDEPVTRPSVDFAAHDLAVAEFMLSPASAGIEVFDDGTTVSYVQRQRTPCADDPLPMPMMSTVTYQIEKGAKRGHQTLTCTLPSRCS